MNLLEYYNKETKTLSFPLNYNKELKNLPEDVENIIFSENYEDSEFSKFNCKVDNLPNNLQSITFGYDFNQPIDKLPKNLQSITFGPEFNQPIDKLPTTVDELAFWSHSNIKNNIPEFISNIKIIFYYDDIHNQQIDNLPCHIKK